MSTLKISMVQNIFLIISKYQLKLFRFIGNTVLHIAAQNGRDEVIPDLLLNGADVNKGNNHKNSALHLGN